MKMIQVITCEHGALARSCEICERDEDIVALRAEVERLTAECQIARTVAAWGADRIRRLADTFGEPGLRIHLGDVVDVLDRAARGEPLPTFAGMDGRVFVRE